MLKTIYRTCLKDKNIPKPIKSKLKSNLQAFIEVQAGRVNDREAQEGAEALKRVLRWLSEHSEELFKHFEV